MDKLNEKYKNIICETEFEDEDDHFEKDEMIIYNFKYTAKIVKVHTDCGLLDVVLFHPTAAVMSSPVAVSSNLCMKFHQP